MSVLLTKWAGSVHPILGSQRFVPAVADALPDWSVIDLRPDATLVDGYTLVGTTGDTTQAALLKAGGLKLGDTLDDTLGTVLRNRIGNNLGLTLSDLTVRALLRTILFASGRSDGTRWRNVAANRLTGRYEIFLGPYADSVAVVSGGSTDDPFTYSDGSLGTVSSAAWVVISGALSVSSNQVVTTSTTGNGNARLDTDLGSSDNDSQIEIVTGANDSNTNHLSQAEAWCRQAGTSAVTYYGNLRYYSTVANVHGGYIRKMVAGSETQLASDYDVAFSANEALYVAVSGSSISAKLQGSAVSGSPVTDTGLSSGNYVGFGLDEAFNSTGNAAAIDNFTTSLGGGGADVHGDATISGTGSVAASASHTAHADAAIAGTGAVAGSAVYGAHANGSISGTGTVAASGSHTARADGTVSGTGTVAGSAHVGLHGDGAVSGTGGVAASGSHTAHADAAIAGTGTVGASASHTAHADAAISGTGTIAASGSVSSGTSVHGDATLSGTGAVAASGHVGLHGDGVISGTGTLAATGTVTVHGDGSISGTGTLAASAHLGLHADAAISGTGTITGSFVAGADLFPLTLTLRERSTVTIDETSTVSLRERSTVTIDETSTLTVRERSTATVKEQS